MKHIATMIRPIYAVGLGVLCALSIAACSTNPSEGIQKSLAHTTPMRKKIASMALAQVGDAYGANMAGPDQYDDSGLVYYVYRQNGRTLPRDRRAQLDAGQPIPLPNAEPGDLVFFRVDSRDGKGRLTVGVLIDADLAVMALPGPADQGGGVRRVSTRGDYWRQHLVGASRLLPSTVGSADS